MHENELTIDIALVRKLVDSQFPQYAELPLEVLAATGSTNVQFRLGSDFIVRLPRLPNSAATIAKEVIWTPKMGAALPIQVPEFVGAGEPAFGYSEPWLIVRWIAGEHPKPHVLGQASGAEQLRLASDLAEAITVLRGVRVLDSAETTPSLQSYRGRSLAAYDAQMQRNFAQCRALAGLDLDIAAAERLWRESLALPDEYDGQPNWFHGDLVAENLLIEEGRLVAVLDWGALAVGDPTIDLHGAWELFGPEAREVFRTAMGASDVQWLRGRAWALAVAMMTFPYYWHTLPRRVADRLAMARAVLADAE